MRNIFDQYSQPENRITHALMTALNEDRRLLDNFLRDVAGRSPAINGARLHITEQSYPGKAVADGINEAEIERRGVPDAWITADAVWCLVIENKVLSTPSIDQLHRHLATARRLGFADPKALLLTAQQPRAMVPQEVTVATWKTVYNWLQGQAARSEWAQRLSAYLEVMEARLTDLEQMRSGTLTDFHGFEFGEEGIYSDLEAKRILRLAMDRLRERQDLPSKIGIDPRRSGKKALRGAWDILVFASSPESDNFTVSPHLTLGVGQNSVSAMVTLPNNARAARRHLIAVGEDGFRTMVNAVLTNMRRALSSCPGMEPRLRVQQRHWPSRSASPMVDAYIDVDLRTHSDDREAIKFQPQWIDAAFGSLNKKTSNLELQIGAEFPYATCKDIETPDALDYVAMAWIASRPFISALGMISSHEQS